MSSLVSFSHQRIDVNVSPNAFVKITASVRDAVTQSGIVDGMVLVTSLSDVSSVFVAVDSAEYLACLSAWLAFITKEPDSRPYRDRSDAVHVMKRTVLKKEVLLSLSSSDVDLAGEEVFFAHFGDGGDAEDDVISCSFVVAILGSTDGAALSFPSASVPQKHCRERWRHIGGSIEGALPSPSSGGLCLVSSRSPHCPVYINDYEGGLQSDYQDFQRYWTDPSVVGVDTANFRSMLGRVLMGRELCIGVNAGQSGCGMWGRRSSLFDFGHWEVIFWSENELVSSESSHHEFPNCEMSVLLKLLSHPDFKYARRETGCGSSHSPRFEVTDLTPEVESLLSSSDITQGLALINSLHITSGVCVLSQDESSSFFEYGDPYTPGTEGDFLAFLRNLLPDQYPPFKQKTGRTRRGHGRGRGDYEHNGGGDVRTNPYSNNGDAHHKRQIVSRQAVVPVVGGRLVLGEGQRVLYVECDGKREKKQLITIVGI